jgi:hypothetical protein
MSAGRAAIKRKVFMECPDEPHYQITGWEVTRRTQIGLPIQMLFAKCLTCGSKIAIKKVTAYEY